MPKFIVPNGSGITAQATAGALRIVLGAAAATALAACSASATFFHRQCEQQVGR